MAQAAHRLHSACPLLRRWLLLRRRRQCASCLLLLLLLLWNDAGHCWLLSQPSGAVAPPTFGSSTFGSSSLGASKLGAENLGRLKAGPAAAGSAASAAGLAASGLPIIWSYCCAAQSNKEGGHCFARLLAKQRTT